VDFDFISNDDEKLPMRVYAPRDDIAAGAADNYLKECGERLKASLRFHIHFQRVTSWLSITFDMEKQWV
jgi:hypothetical protein